MQKEMGNLPWEKIQTAQKMQDYIKAHYQDEIFPFDGLYALAGYSERHAVRIFRELTGKTPNEYIRVLRVTKSAEGLLDRKKTILDVALDTSFDSHEGYTKAFSQAFGVSPKQYKKGKTPIPLFIPYPIETYYKHLWKKGEDGMEQQPKPVLCTVTPVERPKRKLMILRSKKARDYWTYCEEVGCEWEGLFNSLPDKMDTAAILTLPLFLQKEGYGEVASGVELPSNYAGGVPDGCELIELAPCMMLYFQSQPVQSEEECLAAIGQVIQAADIYDPSSYGMEWADDAAPRFNFGGSVEKGAKIAIPVRKK